MTDLVREIVRAERRIRPFVRETPLERSPLLSRMSGAEVHLKLENLQYTGSFKARGAMNRMLSLSEEERSKGVVAASTGNHGAAVAFCMGRLGVPGKIFVPRTASPAKVKAIRELGAEVCFHGADCVEAEAYAREHARREGMVYVSPYNDLQVVAGQGTIGVELSRQIGRVDALFASLGGGGLISGIAAYLKALDPETRVTACSPENSPVMAESVKAGRILELPSLPTLSDGTAGGVEPGSVTFDLCRELIDDFVSVSETEIRETLVDWIDTHHMLIEGAAAVAVAGLLGRRGRIEGGNVVVVLCGANIGAATLKDIL